MLGPMVLCPNDYTNRLIGLLGPKIRPLFCQQAVESLGFLVSVLITNY